MALNLVYKDTSIHSLLELGISGHYPLFNEQWIYQGMAHKERHLTKRDRLKVKDIINRLNRHRGIERKKIILMEMKEEDRTLFVRVFLELVEHKIIDKRPGLH